MTVQAGAFSPPRSSVVVRSLSPREDEWLSTLDDDAETSAYGSLIARAVRSLDASSVLDVGCGIGSPTLEAAHAGARRVRGIDIVGRNVERANLNFCRSGLHGRVTAHHASWQDVISGELAIGDVDLVVSNPPYVPSGEGTAVDGGPTGTTLLNAIIDELPQSVAGVALMFGSLSDPVAVIDRLARRGFSITDLELEPVPFGRYTSAPKTLAALKRLRALGRSWFCDVPSDGLGAPHAYLTFGVIARRSDPVQPAGARRTWREQLKSLLDSYQRTGQIAWESSDALALHGNA